MKKTLIVYFSRSGITRQAAQSIARMCDGNIDEIREAGDRLGVWGFLRSCYEALAKCQPSIAASTADPANYGLVIIGTPIWANHVASPVRSYIVSYRDRLRRVAFFCTSRHTPGDAVFAEMARLCEREPVATAGITAQEILTDYYTPRLDPLVKAAAAR